MRENVLVDFWKDEDGIGVVEIVLILVILIALVLIFKNKITAVMNSAFEKFNTDSNGIMGNESSK